MMAYRNTARPTPEFRRRHHTSSIELTTIANEVKPAILVTYHRSNVGEELSRHGTGDILTDEIRQTYPGHVLTRSGWF